MLKIDESNGVLCITATRDRGALFAAQVSLLGLMSFAFAGFAGALVAGDGASAALPRASCGLAVAGGVLVGGAVWDVCRRGGALGGC